MLRNAIKRPQIGVHWRKFIPSVVMALASGLICGESE